MVTERLDAGDEAESVHEFVDLIHRAIVGRCWVGGDDRRDQIGLAWLIGRNLVEPPLNLALAVRLGWGGFGERLKNVHG